MERDHREFKVDYYRTKDQKGFISTPHRGCMITHIPTGVVVVSEKERSVYKNKEVAWVLMSLVLEQCLE